MLLHGKNVETTGNVIKSDGASNTAFWKAAAILNVQRGSAFEVEFMVFGLMVTTPTVPCATRGVMVGIAPANLLLDWTSIYDNIPIANYADVHYADTILDQIRCLCIVDKGFYSGFNKIKLRVLNVTRAISLLRHRMEFMGWQRAPRWYLSQTAEILCNNSNWVGRHVEFFVAVDKDRSPLVRGVGTPLDTRSWVIPLSEHRQVARCTKAAEVWWEDRYGDWNGYERTWAYGSWACGIVQPNKEEDIRTFYEYMGCNWIYGNVALCPGQKEFLGSWLYPDNMCVPNRYTMLRACHQCVPHRHREAPPCGNPEKLPCTTWCADDEFQLATNYVPQCPQVHQCAQKASRAR
jgi:hypothetical protein